jgi:integrase
MTTQVRASTLDSDARVIRRHLVPRLGQVPLQRLQADMLDRMYAELLTAGRRNGQGLAPKTILNLHLVLHRALSDAVEWELVTRNVADKARPPKQTRRDRQVMQTWTSPQLRAFIDSRADDRLVALWHLLASTGMRRGEALGLAWDAVDLDAGRLAVCRTLLNVAYKLEWGKPKTAKSRRSVALDPGTVTVLRAHRKRQLADRVALGPAWEEQGLVFCREDGRPLHPDLASKLFGDAVRASGLPRIRLHDLRHTHATLALQAGIHPKVVSERLGHATVGMTLDVYSHAVPAMQEDAAAKVAALVFGP